MDAMHNGAENNNISLINFLEKKLKLIFVNSFIEYSIIKIWHAHPRICARYNAFISQ